MSKIGGSLGKRLQTIPRLTVSKWFSMNSKLCSHFYKDTSTLLTPQERHFTQGHSGSTGIGVNPEGKPGENHDEQGWGVDAHHVEAHLPSQGEDDLHTRVVPCQTDANRGEVPDTSDCKITVCTEVRSHFCLGQFHKVNSIKNGVFCSVNRHNLCDLRGWNDATCLAQPFAPPLWDWEADIQAALWYPVSASKSLFRDFGMT